MKLTLSHSFLLLLTSFARQSLAAQRTTPPTGCITVSGDGTKQFKTVQSALDSLSTTSTAAQCIFIYPGTYSEQVSITKRSAQLTVYGSTTDTMSYGSNSVTITAGHSQDEQPNNDLTGTVRAWAAGLKIYNVNIVNSRGQGSQAIALSAQADKQGYYGVKLVGYQDTLLANTGDQVYARSYIDGAT
jgi:pectinesterase